MNAPTTLDNLRSPAPREANLPAVRASFFDLQGFELIQRVSKAFAASTLVPKEYQGNVSNCMIALNLAERLKADALMVMQNLYIVHGRPGWSAQFLIATFNQCGRFSALRYEFFGTRGADDWGCRAWAIEKDTGEKVVGADIDIALAKKEGWYGKSGSKWQTMPQQMLMYRSAAWLVRAYAPEIAMGLPTADELADVVDVAPDGSYTVSVESLRQGTAPAQPVDIVDAEAHAHQGPTADTQTSTSASEDDQRADAPTFKDINRELLTASTVEALDFARSLIAEIPDEAQKAALNQVATRRMRELMKADDEPSAAAPAGRRTRAPLNAE